MANERVEKASCKVSKKTFDSICFHSNFIHIHMPTKSLLNCSSDSSEFSKWESDSHRPELDRQLKLWKLCSEMSLENCY